jgi:hypothetical protein
MKTTSSQDRPSGRKLAVHGRLLLFLFLAVMVALPAFTQDIANSAIEQIIAIEQMKQTFTPAEQKMSTNLVLASRLARHEFVPAFAVRIVSESLRDSKGRYEVDIHATGTDAIAGEITRRGGEVTVHRPLLQHIRAHVDPAHLLQVASDPGVSWIREADRATTNVGALTSQGYISHGANQAVALGITGSGVNVGVLSDSATPARVAALIASGDLPPDVTIVPGQDGGAGTDEGTAMMEIIHDLAPGANLFFATAFNGQASFADNIRTLRFVYHCDIIVDDVTYFAEGAFQDGTIALAVNDVVADGALYFSSAANSGNLTSGTSGTWEGDFQNGGAVDSPISGLGETGYLHNFGGGQVYDRLTATTTTISLQWSDPLGLSGNDYDLFVLNSAGTTVLGFSAAAQTGTQDPLEIAYRSAGFAANSRVVVVLYSGDQRALRVDTNRGQLSIRTAGSTFGHNAGLNTITAAATYWNSARTGTRPFVGATNPIETFSSDGPRKIFYSPDGGEITPGNLLFSTSGGTTLQKPDVTAADGVSTKTPGFLPFFGTSAAAPHAAAIAALVKSAKPTLTNVQIKQILFTTTVDNMSAGVDRDGGYGIVMALPAVQAAKK